MVTLFPDVELTLTRNKIRNQYFKHTVEPPIYGPSFEGTPPLEGQILFYFISIHVYLRTPPYKDTKVGTF